jgi:hypothetical protein
MGTAQKLQGLSPPLADADDAIRRFYEVFRLGNSNAATDEGATLIKQV